MKLLTSAFIALNVWLYRVSGGRMMGRMGAAPILLLTTTGRRSRRERTVPVLYLEDGGRFVIVASLAGAPRHPAWFLNLEANPRVRLQVRSRRFAATARRASVEEKAQLWPRLVAMYPAYEGYQNRTTRDIPVVIATPEPERSQRACTPVTTAATFTASGARCSATASRPSRSSRRGLGPRHPAPSSHYLASCNLSHWVRRTTDHLAEKMRLTTIRKKWGKK